MPDIQTPEEFAYAVYMAWRGEPDATVIAMIAARDAAIRKEEREAIERDCWLTLSTSEILLPAAPASPCRARSRAMSEMVERAARALHARDPHGNKTPWDDLPPPWQYRYRDDARAAIASMRVPTPEMLAAAMAETATDLESEWRAMIDAALLDPASPEASQGSAPTVSPAKPGGRSRVAERGLAMTAERRQPVEVPPRLLSRESAAERIQAARVAR